MASSEQIRQEWVSLQVVPLLAQRLGCRSSAVSHVSSSWKPNTPFALLLVNELVLARAGFLPQSRKYKAESD